MTFPIFSGLIFMLSMRGACGLVSARGLGSTLSMLLRMLIRASLAIVNTSRIVSISTPRRLRSSCNPVMPNWVPATLKSISPWWSSSPRMSTTSCRLPFQENDPIEMPATG